MLAFRGLSDSLSLSLLPGSKFRRRLPSQLSWLAVRYVRVHSHTHVLFNLWPLNPQTFNEHHLRRSLKTIMLYGDNDRGMEDSSFPEQVSSSALSLSLSLSFPSLPVRFALILYLIEIYTPLKAPWPPTVVYALTHTKGDATKYVSQSVSCAWCKAPQVSINLFSLSLSLSLSSLSSLCRSESCPSIFTTFYWTQSKCKNSKT